MMQLLPSSLSFTVLACFIARVSGASWGFTDATVAVERKGTGAGGGFKEK